MTKPLLIATAAGSLVVGFAIGYKVAEKRLSDQFENRLQKETSSMREFYQVAKKPFATPQEAAAELIQDDEETTAEKVNHKVAYHKIVKTNYTPEADPEEAMAIDNEGRREPPEDELRHHNLFREEPHIISQEEFMQNDSEYIQSTLTYYELDEVLTDDRENVIEELDETVGKQNMMMFGTKSSDPNIVHIRNGRLQMEFEVCRSGTSYQREVLGIEEDPPELPSGRKRT